MIYVMFGNELAELAQIRSPADLVAIRLGSERSGFVCEMVRAYNREQRHLICNLKLLFLETKHHRERRTVGCLPDGERSAA